MLPKGEIVEVMFKIRVVCTRYLAMYFWLRGICREKKKNIRVSTINRHIIMTAFFFSTAVQASILHDSWACSPAREAAAAQDPSSAPAAAAVAHWPSTSTRLSSSSSSSSAATGDEGGAPQLKLAFQRGPSSSHNRTGTIWWEKSE